MRARALAARLTSTLAIVALLSALGAVASPALAQGKKGGAPAASQKTPPGQAKKQVSPKEAVVVTRDLLIKHGFQVVRVETVKGAEVIYYRAGNQGRGRGQGPLRQMIVRPSGNIVTFESAPEGVRLDIKLQFGF